MTFVPRDTFLEVLKFFRVKVLFIVGPYITKGTKKKGIKKEHKNNGLSDFEKCVRPKTFHQPPRNVTNEFSILQTTTRKLFFM